MKYIFALVVALLAAATEQAPPERAAAEQAALQQEVMDGMQLTADQAISLEAGLEKNPDDLKARTELLGYYFVGKLKSAEAKENGRKNILWFIRNRPELELVGQPFCQLNAFLDPDGYHDAKQLWLDQIKTHSQNAAVLGHAAGLFLLSDKDLVEDLLKQAENLEPSKPVWCDQLGHLYLLQKGKESAAKALVEFEKAQAADTSDEGKFDRLVQLAKSALAAGENEKASQYANDLLKAAEKLPKNWNYGNAIHHGNNVLGRLALAQGNIKQADEFLLKAGQTPGSSQLNFFGPDMSLAKELLDVGEKDTVLEYFELCRKFWGAGGTKLSTWTKAVNAGIAPEFDTSLVH